MHTASLGMRQDICNEYWGSSQHTKLDTWCMHTLNYAYMLSVQARFAGLATDPAYAKYYTGYTNGYVEFHIT